MDRYEEMMQQVRNALGEEFADELENLIQNKSDDSFERGAAMMAMCCR